jgi:hypothetical protein
VEHPRTGHSYSPLQGHQHINAVWRLRYETVEKPCGPCSQPCIGAGQQNARPRQRFPAGLSRRGVVHGAAQSPPLPLGHQPSQRMTTQPRFGCLSGREHSGLQPSQADPGPPTESVELSCLESGNVGEECPAGWANC